MLFHSQTFMLLFAPAVIAGYYAVARHRILREWWLRPLNC